MHNDSGVDLLDSGQGRGLEQAAKTLSRSVGRLRAMGEMLSQTEHHVVWTSKEEAFDAARVIAEYHRAVAS